MDTEVQVRPGRESGGAYISDLLALLHMAAYLDSFGEAALSAYKSWCIRSYVSLSGNCPRRFDIPLAITVPAPMLRTGVPAGAA